MCRTDVAAMDTEASVCSSEGWTTGYSTGGDDDWAFFRDDMDPVALLQGMEEQHGNDVSVALQPYELVRKARKEARERDLTDQESATDAEGTKSKFERGLDTLARRKRRRRNVKKSERTEQEEVIKKLEAEAVLLFAANRVEEGERVCREVMRMAPNSADVYQTLGSMIEQTGQHRKALDYYMIAAHLAPKKTEFWKQLSRSSSELGFHRQAIYCLTHVLRIDKSDVDTHIDRALLYAELGENKRACDAFEKINAMRPGDFEVVKMLGKLYHRMGHSHKAIEVLEQTILLYEDQMDFTVVNILVDLYLQQGSYSEASELISRAESVLCFGQALPIDLKVKHGICSLHMGDPDSAYSQFGDLLKEPIDECVDLYLQAGDALAEVEEYHQALNLFERLVVTAENGPALWERITRCKKLTEGRSAVVSWWLQMVDGLELTHGHYLNAALASIKGLVELGDLELADERMTQLKELLDADRIHFPQNEKEASAAMLMKESLEMRIGKKHNSLEDMVPIVFNTLKKMKRDYRIADSDMHFPVTKELSEVMERVKRSRGTSDVSDVDPGRERRAIFTGFRSLRKEKRFARNQKMLSDSEAAGSSDAPGTHLLLIEDFLKLGEQYSIFMKVIDGLMEKERWNDADYFLTSAIAISCKLGRNSDQIVRDALRVKWIEVAYRLGKFSEGLECVKKLCAHWPYSIKVWNTYSRLLCKIGSEKWLTKFVTSYRQKVPASVPVTVIMGQLLSLLGRHDMAIGEYREALKALPESPLIWLCLGVAKLNQAMIEFSGNDRNFAVVQAMTMFSRYARLRGNAQEVWFNFGRAFHQVGLKFLAVEYYNKALEAEAPEEKRDLKRVIAYNLVQVYRSAGSLVLARSVMQRYLRI